MRRLWFPVLVVLLCFSANAFATCPTPPTGPYMVGFTTFNDYTQDQSCYTTSNTSAGSIACSGDPSWSFGTGTGSASVSFTIGAGDWVGATNHWSAGSWVDFTSLGGTSGDRFEIDVDVEHPNHTISRYTVIFHGGPNGNINSCSAGPIWAYFDADHGDTVTVSIGVTKTSTGTIVITRPRIFSQSP
ncbi:MAG: hypothetical protein JOZ54_11650 [Acidobacteria bacterium]|nr:hypothetical protein [Acidobacteriota bacterium]